MALEEWALGMIPRPVSAVMLLYPVTEAVRARRDCWVSCVHARGQLLQRSPCRAQSEEHRRAVQAAAAASAVPVPPSLYFTKQVVGACLGERGGGGD